MTIKSLSHAVACEDWLCFLNRQVHEMHSWALVSRLMPSASRHPSSRSYRHFWGWSTSTEGTYPASPASMATHGWAMQPQEVAGAAGVVRHPPGPPPPHSRSRCVLDCGCLSDACGYMPQAAAMRQKALAALRLEAGGCTAEVYSALDRELFGYYSSTRHFRYMLDGPCLAVFMDHKPLTYPLCKIACAASVVAECRWPLVVRNMAAGGLPQSQQRFV